MKKLKLSALLLTITSFSLLLLSACSTIESSKTTKPQDTTTQLTKTEYKQLIESARNTLINMPDNRINNKDKEFITRNEPEVRITYNGDKRGSYNIVWENTNTKLIQVIGHGDLTSYADSFQRVSVVAIKVSPDESQLPSQRVKQ